MKCPKCNREIDNDSVYCGYCGVKVRKQKVRNPLWIVLALIVLALCCIILFVVRLALITDTDSFSGYYSVNTDSVLIEPVGEYINLGLPSGTLWKDVNESENFYEYDEAVGLFGDKLPTKEQWVELKNECTWDWTGNGYNVTGKNGNSITLPAAGYRWLRFIGWKEEDITKVGYDGRYWSSTQFNSEGAWYLDFDSIRVVMDGHERSYGHSVRLVQD